MRGSVHMGFEFCDLGLLRRTPAPLSGCLQIPM